MHRPDDLEIFRSLAYLFGPADPGRPSLVVGQDERWSTAIDGTPEVDVILWGRMPVRGRPDPGVSLRAVRRELALARLRVRPPTGFRVGGIQRLAPVRRPGRFRMAIRDATMAGLVVELVRSDRPWRVIDSVAQAAGSRLRPRLRPSGDGSALARLTLTDGQAVELRVAQTGHTKDPLRARGALLALQAAEVAHVPRPVAAGQTAGATWTTETVMAGGHAADLTARLVDDVIGLCTMLPTQGGPARAITDNLTTVARVFPHHAEVLEALASSAVAWTSSMPAVLEHGDLWLNNLITGDGRLRGLIDWDTWHPAGVPGSDLIALIAAEERRRSKRESGDLLVDDYWRSPVIDDVLGRYFRALSLRRPDTAGRAGVAVGWWASRVAGSLYRATRPATDRDWVAHNIDAPIAYLEALSRRLG
jgi:hypothetical protein